MIRACRWGLTVSCVLLLILSVGSAWYWCFTWWGIAHGHLLVLLADGLVILFWSPWPVPLDVPHFELTRAALDSPNESGGGTAIPILLLVLILLVPTVLLWRRSMRPPPEGFCRRCNYDLTRNTSGRCPECGEAIAPRGNAEAPFQLDR